MQIFKFNIFFIIIFSFKLSGTNLFSSSTDNNSDTNSAEHTDKFEVCDFMSLTKIQNPTMGYLLNDTCIVEAEIEVLASNGQYLPVFSWLP